MEGLGADAEGAKRRRHQSAFFNGEKLQESKTISWTTSIQNVICLCGFMWTDLLRAEGMRDE